MGSERRADTSVDSWHSDTNRSTPEQHSKSRLKKFRPSLLIPRVGILPPFHLPKLLPSVDFPNQGRGCTSEFNQVTPVWVYQPMKAAYTVFFILFTAFIYLPWQAVLNISPSHRGRPSWTWGRSMTVVFFRRCIEYISSTRVRLTKKPPTKTPTLHKSEFVWLEPSDHLRPSPDGTGPSPDLCGELARAMQVQGVGVERIAGYWYFPPGSALHCATPLEKDEQVIYHLHGGAYWMGTGHESGPVGHFYLELLRRLDAKGSEGKRVPRRTFALEYRLADHTNFCHGSYPAALIDTVVGYLYLVRTCGYDPKNIILAGDSSGGNLALALCRFLRDEGVAPVPSAMLLFSPWSDVSRSHSGPVQAPNAFSTTVKNKQCDVLDHSVLYRNTTVMAFLGNLPASEAYLNPYISPVSLHLALDAGGSPPDWGFAGFPVRTFISTGSAELNNEQHLTLAHRMACGTPHARPIYTGDLLCASECHQELMWRSNYPRSHHAATLYKDKGEAASEEPTLEDREVILDEVKDAIHIFPFFTWYEPERGQLMDRIVDWITTSE